MQAGGTLIVTDPDAFTRTPAGAPLADVRDALVGAPLGPVRRGSVLEVPQGALDGTAPDDLLTVPLDAPRPRAFAAVPAGARVVARFIDGAPAALLRDVGRGRVLAWAADPMSPGRPGRAARPGAPGRRPAALGRRHHGQPGLGLPHPGRPRPGAAAVGGRDRARRRPGGPVMTDRRWG